MLFCRNQIFLKWIVLQIVRFQGLTDELQEICCYGITCYGAIRTSLDPSREVWDSLEVASTLIRNIEGGWKRLLLYRPVLWHTPTVHSGVFSQYMDDVAVQDVHEACADGSRACAWYGARNVRTSAFCQLIGQRLRVRRENRGTPQRFLQKNKRFLSYWKLSPHWSNTDTECTGSTESEESWIESCYLKVDIISISHR